MNNLPKSWQVKSLGEIAEIVTGGTPSTAIKEYWEGGDIPWLNSGELNQGMVTSSSNYITQLGLKNSVAKLMPPDTILIALTGATTGRIGYLTFKACANQSVTGILPSANHDPKFLYYHLQTLRENILKIAWGGAQKHINQKFVKDLKIPLPPLPIQKQIAEILEKADEAKQKRKEANKLTDEFLQSVFIEMFGDPVKNPKGWEITTIMGLAKKDKNAIKAGPFGSSLKKECYVEKGFKIYGQEQIIRDDLQYGDYFISKDKYEELKNYAVQGGDILISLVGTYGKISIVPERYEQGIINPRLMKVSLNQTLMLPVFFKYYFQNTSFQKMVSNFSHGGTMDIVNIGILKALPFITPPLTLQQQFAEIVNKTEALKEKQKQSEQELENLFQSLMQKAFKGELEIR
jgi:type I restriction enzyme S subunit